MLARRKCLAGAACLLVALMASGALAADEAPKKDESNCLSEQAVANNATRAHEQLVRLAKLIDPSGRLTKMLVEFHPEPASSESGAQHEHHHDGHDHHNHATLADPLEGASSELDQVKRSADLSSDSAITTTVAPAAAPTNVPTSAATITSTTQSATSSAGPQAAANASSTTAAPSLAGQQVKPTEASNVTVNVFLQLAPDSKSDELINNPDKLSSSTTTSTTSTSTTTTSTTTTTPAPDVKASSNSTEAPATVSIATETGPTGSTSAAPAAPASSKPEASRRRRRRWAFFAEAAPAAAPPAPSSTTASPTTSSSSTAATVAAPPPSPPSPSTSNAAPAEQSKSAPTTTSAAPSSTTSTTTTTTTTTTTPAPTTAAPKSTVASAVSSSTTQQPVVVVELSAKDLATAAASKTEQKSAPSPVEIVVDAAAAPVAAAPTTTSTTTSVPSSTTSTTSTSTTPAPQPSSTTAAPVVVVIAAAPAPVAPMAPAAPASPVSSLAPSKLNAFLGTQSADNSTTTTTSKTVSAESNLESNTSNLHNIESETSPGRLDATLSAAVNGGREGGENKTGSLMDLLPMLDSQNVIYDNDTTILAYGDSNGTSLATATKPMLMMMPDMKSPMKNGGLKDLQGVQMDMDEVIHDNFATCLLLAQTNNNNSSSNQSSMPLNSTLGRLDFWQPKENRGATHMIVRLRYNLSSFVNNNNTDSLIRKRRESFTVPIEHEYSPPTESDTRANSSGSQQPDDRSSFMSHRIFLLDDLNSTTLIQELKFQPNILADQSVDVDSESVIGKDLHLSGDKSIIGKTLEVRLKSSLAANESDIRVASCKIKSVESMPPIDDYDYSHSASVASVIQPIRNELLHSPTGSMSMQMSAIRERKTEGQKDFSG